MIPQNLKNKIKTLDRESLLELNDLIDKEIRTRLKIEHTEATMTKYEDVGGRFTYEMRRTNCKKCKKCKINSSINHHGPYWYEFRRENKKQKSKYIGKTLKIGLNKSEHFIGAELPTPGLGIVIPEGYDIDGNLNVTVKNNIKKTEKTERYQKLIKKDDPLYQKIRYYDGLFKKGSPMYS